VDHIEKKQQTELWDEKRTAEFLGCSVSTLQKDRHFNRGLSYVRLGGRLIRYLSDDVFEYLKMHRINPGHPKGG